MLKVVEAEKETNTLPMQLDKLLLLLNQVADGVERWVVLELKMIADVGLLGFPNVGKSTFLSVVTKAKPKIANYHFTTLTPNFRCCSN